MRDGVESAREPDDVEAWAAALWGAPGGVSRGVVQPFAATPVGDEWRVLRAGPPGPPSPLDAFALGHTRARVDAVVTSGRNLREEPRENYAYPIAGEALARWRCERAGRERLPLLAVITSGRGLDLDHPALAPGRRRVLYTGSDGAARLGAGARRRGIAVWAVDAPDPTDLLRRLLDGEGAALVSVEAGPSVSRPLYAPDAPVPVDELVLTAVRGGVPASALGPALLRRADLDARYPEVDAPSEHREGARLLRFARRCRRRGAAATSFERTETTPTHRGAEGGAGRRHQ